MEVNMADYVETSADRKAASVTLRELSEAELPTVADGAGKITFNPFVITKVVVAASLPVTSSPWALNAASDHDQIPHRWRKRLRRLSWDQASEPSRTADERSRFSRRRWNAS
jgi:hypothetical protein